MIKSEVSSKAWDLGKLVSTAMNLIAFQNINTLLMRVEMILTNMIFDVALRNVSVSGLSTQLSKPIFFK